MSLKRFVVAAVAALLLPAAALAQANPPVTTGASPTLRIERSDTAASRPAVKTHSVKKHKVTKRHVVKHTVTRKRVSHKRTPAPKPV